MVKEKNNGKIQYYHNIEMKFKKRVLFVAVFLGILVLFFDPAHVDLRKVISIAFVGGGLVLKGFGRIFSITAGCSVLIPGRKPLRIRPRRCLGGISFEISHFEDPHEPRLERTYIKTSERYSFCIMKYSEKRYGRKIKGSV